jgi:hypothetical protein
MNDLRTLGAALAQDEPSQDVVDRSRHRLRHHMRGHRPMRRRAWFAVTAAAAVAAVAAVALPAGEAPPARDGLAVLLAAADVAERTPEGTGTYWHYKVHADSAWYEYWITADGEYWRRFEDGKVEKAPDRRAHPFSLIGVPLTLDQLRALPTDPAALQAWIAEAVADNGRDDPATDPLKEWDTLDSLVSLVSMLPAPPEVRAAAFRAIAAYPGVEPLGDVPGGQGVLLPGNDVIVAVSVDGREVGRRLVVDPATGRANGTTFFVNLSGERHIVGDPEGVRITAEWTDSLPS